MTNEKNQSQEQSAAQEGLLPLEEQQLEEVIGGTDLLKRELKPEIEGTNYGTYIPPTDPDTHPYLRLLGIKPNEIPENHSYTFDLKGKNIIHYIRPGYTIEHKK